MHSSRLYWKLFFTFVGFTTAATLVLATIAYRSQQERMHERLVDRLDQMSQLVAAQARVHAADPPTLARQAFRIAEVGQVRVMLVGEEGNVWFDSDRGPQVIEADEQENVKERPDVVAALAAPPEGPPTQRIDNHIHYSTLRIDGGPLPLVVRNAINLTDNERQLARFGYLLGWVSLAIVLASALVTWLVSRQVLLPLRKLVDAAHAIARGDYGHNVYVSGEGELAELATSFNEMSDALGEQLTQLIASDQRQSAVLGGMVEGVIAIDRRQRIQLANPAAGRLFGFSASVVQGRPLIEVIRDNSLHEAARQVLASREPQRLELKWEVGPARSLEVAITPFPGEGNKGAVLVLHDNTELRRLETIRQEFMANVSHELKTPLSSIMAYTETLLGGAIDDHEHREQFLHRIAEQGERLSNLIHDMLALARIEGAHQKLEITSLVLAPIARQCVDDHTPLAESKQIELSIPEGLPDVKVAAEGEGLRTILNNLVDNAVKYTPDRGRVEVRWHEDDGHVRIEVADTGLGIPRAEQPRIFERFYRVDRARSQQLGSTGLGLSIVKHLVQAMHGTVGVESTVGKGSTFWVRLPVAE